MKKIILIMLLGFLPSIVSAKILEGKEVVEIFNENYATSEIGNFKAELNTENNSIIIHFGTESDEFRIKDNYLEFSPNSVECAGTATLLNMSLLIDTIIKASGYDDTTINNWGIIHHYEKYGIDSNLNDDGCLNEFRISLDTDKIDNLIVGYGVKNDNVQSLMADMSFYNITDTSVEIVLKVWQDLIPEGVTELKCNLYRSTSEFDSYVLVNDEPVDCFNGSKILDNNLNPNTKYFYKNSVIGYGNFDSVFEITTKEKLSENSLSNVSNVVDNPKTGVSSHFGILMIGIASLIGAIYLRKKWPFKRIG